jgi:predicted kinase
MIRRRLICTVGLPRAGKSTWARSQGHPIVNPDSIRYALHGQRFAAEAEPFVWAIAQVMVRALFAAGHDVVIVDATNVTKKRRDVWMSNDWDTEFEVFQTSEEECLNRNHVANDAELIPVIRRMASEFEPISDDGGRWVVTYKARTDVSERIALLPSGNVAANVKAPMRQLLDHKGAVIELTVNLANLPAGSRGQVSHVYDTNHETTDEPTYEVAFYGPTQGRPPTTVTVKANQCKIIA